MCLQRLATALDDADQIADRPFEVVVHHDVVELIPVGHIPDRVPKAAGDYLFRVGAAVSEAFFQGSARRWQHEDGYALGQRLPYLLRALPIDFEDDVIPARKLRLHWTAPGPVK